MLGSSLVIAVLMGGVTGEREVSLKTGAAVARALQQRGHRVLDVQLEADGTTWSCGDESGTALDLLAGCLARVDVFWIALHGGDGEGGALQGLFETLGLVHTGSGVAASALCMDKLGSLRFLRQEGLRIAAHSLFTELDYRKSQDHAKDMLERARRLPGAERGLSVKPRRGGSSVATSLLGPDEVAGSSLAEAIEAVFEVSDDALVEERIVGIEVTCPVLDSSGGVPSALQPVEIRPKQGRFFDYEEKYSEGGAEEFCPPRSLDLETVTRLQELALRAHRTSGCSGYSRTDFIIPQGEQNPTPVLLEVNTLPGMTPRSLFPLSASQAGLDFGELCERIATAAFSVK
ncbi:MAG: D-alanine-D-alanine ligase [Planctomycetota bacterium]|jgi:D-alanine-D-alanine ligase